MSYLIVEPYQVRHEVLVDVSSTRSWIDIAVDASGQIPLESQTEVSEAVAALVSERVVLTIDGASGRAASTRAEFIELGPAGASTRPAPVPEPLESAILGVIVVYETSGIADSVEIDWNLFSDEISRIPFTIVDPAAVDEKEVSPEVPRVLWRNTLEDIEVPEIEAVAASSAKLPLLSMGLILLALIVARRHAIAVVCLFAAYIAYPFARTEASVAFAGAPRLDRVEASELIDSLLTNVYRAFDIHNEDLIYDRLALSVTGDQLRDVYLESRRALELENRGGASVRIDEVVVQEIRAIRETGDGGYEIDAVWTVGGSVNHFGHIHFRQNRYDAAIGIVPAGGTWKIRELELVEEKRLL